MAQKIQLKRGNRKNLPKLSLGEPAFSLDTKELFVGNSVINQQIQARENIIVNGNFQVVCENFDAVTNKIVIAPGTSRFIYGNFYLSNATTSLGNITVSSPNNGFITIECMNAQMSFEYREKLAEYLIGSTQTYSSIRSLLNQDVTLSFDYKNTGNSLNFSSGSSVSVLNNISIPAGTGTISNNFLMRYATLGSVHSTRIVLLSTLQNSTYTISIGNVKLESGTYKTPFSPNPMYTDILAIEQVYKVYDASIRCLNGNVGDIFNLYFPVSVPICFKNSTAKITINKSTIYSYDGIQQTGFTLGSSYLSDYSCIQFQAKKPNNLLKEIYLIINFSLDLRPY